MLSASAIQTALQSHGLYKGAIDGIAGKGTKRAIDDFLAKDKDTAAVFQGWTDDRQMVAMAQIICRDLDIEVGKIDGLVGEQSRYAFDVFLARQVGDKSVETWRDEREKQPAAGPPKKAMQWPRQSECTSFFGSPGSNQISMELPFPMRIAWEPAKTVNRFSCNKHVHDAMSRIFKNTLDHYGYEELKRLRLDMFGGCLNVRKMRGGSSYSMHSWGIAVDVDPDRNQLKWTRDKATLDDAPYKKFWEFVYAEGAISLGIERNYDWMHFQFARL